MFDKFDEFHMKLMCFQSLLKAIEEAADALPQATTEKAIFCAGEYVGWLIKEFNEATKGVEA